MARLSASTTRSATLGIAAAAMLAATSLASPTRADEPGKGAIPKIEGLPAQCLKAGNELARLKCGRAVFQKQTADAEARSAEAKAQSAKAKAQSADAKTRGAAAEKQTSTANASTQCMERVAQEAGDPKKLSAEQKAAVRAKILSCG